MDERGKLSNDSGNKITFIRGRFSFYYFLHNRFRGRFRDSNRADKGRFGENNLANRPRVKD